MDLGPYIHITKKAETALGVREQVENIVHRKGCICLFYWFFSVRPAPEQGKGTWICYGQCTDLANETSTKSAGTQPTELYST